MRLGFITSNSPRFSNTVIRGPKVTQYETAFNDTVIVIAFLREKLLTVGIHEFY